MRWKPRERPSSSTNRRARARSSSEPQRVPSSRHQAGTFALMCFTIGCRVRENSGNHGVTLLRPTTAYYITTKVQEEAVSSIVAFHPKGRREWNCSNITFWSEQQNIVHPTKSSSRNFNHLTFIVPYSRCNVHFFCTAIRQWNFIPLEAHTSERLLQFKKHLSIFLSP